MRVTKQEQIQDWTKFLHHETLRYDEQKFEKALRKNFAASPLNGLGILAAWAPLRPGFRRINPLFMTCFEQLSNLHLFSDVDVLSFVAQRLKDVLENQERYHVKSGCYKGMWKDTIEAAVLERSAWRMVNCRDLTVAPGDRLPDVRICKPLVRLVVLFTELLEGSSTIEGPALEIGTELGKFVAAYMHNLSLVGLLTCDDGRPPKAFRRLFGAHLPPFIALMSAVHTELATTLGALQAQSGLLELQAPDHIDDSIANDLDAITYRDSVLDSPIVHTRAALYVFLNAMLTGRPICDDTALFTFLNTRYGENVPSLLVDLITAAFDVLGNAANRTEPAASINVCRSFIVNKMPMLIEAYASMVFPPLTVESCVTDAFRRLDPAGDSYANTMGEFDILSENGMLNEAKQDFLFACALFKLIPESSIETILGDVPIQNLPSAGKYVKAELIEQCSANPSRFEQLIGELENMEGNSGEIAAALVEVGLGMSLVLSQLMCYRLSKRYVSLKIP